MICQEFKSYSIFYINESFTDIYMSLAEGNIVDQENSTILKSFQ